MLNRMVAGAVIVMAMVVGYAYNGTTVAGQASGKAPIEVGDKVTFIYQRYAADREAPSVRCEVAQLSADYVRCAPEERIGFRDPQGERWINLDFVAQINKAK